MTGRIWIGDKEVQDVPPERRGISYVPQDLALFPHLNVKQNILFGIRARDLDMKTYEEYVSALVEVMKIGHLLERYPAHLSGGEKKRVALLRALAPKPKLLLLDEPLSGLDPSIKVDIQHLLRNLHASFHPTTLCVTHDFEEVYFLGDEMTIFIDGKVEQVGKRDNVFQRPNSKGVAQFLGAKNLYRAKVLKNEKSSQRLILGVNGLHFSIPTSLYQDRMEVGKEVDLVYPTRRSDDTPRGKTREGLVKTKYLSKGEVLDITDKERYHTGLLSNDRRKDPF